MALDVAAPSADDQQLIFRKWRRHQEASVLLTSRISTLRKALTHCDMFTEHMAPWRLLLQPIPVPAFTMHATL